MEWVKFPIQVSVQGWLQRSTLPLDSLVQLIQIMGRTPRQGWRGSDIFGLRDSLTEMAIRSESRSSAIKMINQILTELDINWVKIEDIQVEITDHSGQYACTLTFVDPNQGIVVHQMMI